MPASTSSSSPSPRHHKPVMFSPSMVDQREGGTDPAVIVQAAHSSAWAILTQGRDSRDPEITQRLIEFTDHYGLEAIAETWADCPPVSLPGALWRIYALRDTVRAHPELISWYFSLGLDRAEVSRAVAGVADPPHAEELCRSVDQILAGAYTREFDVALERFAAFCRVVALGQALAADRSDAQVPRTGGSRTQAPTVAGSLPDQQAESWHGFRMTRSSRRLIGTAEELEAAASAWRHGQLD